MFFVTSYCSRCLFLAADFNSDSVYLIIYGDNMQLHKKKVRIIKFSDTFIASILATCHARTVQDKHVPI